MDYAQEIYNLSVKYWYSVADDRMKKCGHPGIPGPASDDKSWNITIANLEGAITSLSEIRNKLQNGI